MGWVGGAAARGAGRAEGGGIIASGPGRGKAGGPGVGVPTGLPGGGGPAVVVPTSFEEAVRRAPPPSTCLPVCGPAHMTTPQRATLGCGGSPPLWCAQRYADRGACPDRPGRSGAGAPHFSENGLRGSRICPRCGPPRTATPHRPSGGPGVGRRPYRCHSERSPRSEESRLCLALRTAGRRRGPSLRSGRQGAGLAAGRGGAPPVRGAGKTPPYKERRLKPAHGASARLEPPLGGVYSSQGPLAPGVRPAARLCAGLEVWRAGAALGRRTSLKTACGAAESTSGAARRARRLRIGRPAGLA